MFCKWREDSRHLKKTFITDPSVTMQHYGNWNLIVNNLKKLKTERMALCSLVLRVPFDPLINPLSPSTPATLRVFPGVRKYQWLHVTVLRSGRGTHLRVAALQSTGANSKLSVVTLRTSRYTWIKEASTLLLHQKMLRMLWRNDRIHQFKIVNSSDPESSVK